MGAFVAAFNALDPNSDPQGWIVPPPCRRRPVAPVNPTSFSPWKTLRWVLLFLSLTAAAVYGWMRSQNMGPVTSGTKTHFISEPKKAGPAATGKQDDFLFWDGAKETDDRYQPTYATPSYFGLDPYKEAIRDPFEKPAPDPRAETGSQNSQ